MSGATLSEYHFVILIPIINGECHAHRRVDEKGALIVGLITIAQGHRRKGATLEHIAISIEGFHKDVVRGLCIGHDSIYIKYGRRAAVADSADAIQRVRATRRNVPAVEHIADGEAQLLALSGNVIGNLQTEISHDALHEA